jgi:hypothetical protein
MKFSQAKADLELKQQLADAEKSPILAEFEAKARAAREQFDVALREYKRQVELREKDSTPLATFDKAGEQLEMMRALVDTTAANKRTKQLELDRDAKVALAAHEIAQWNVDQQTILSPIEGRVLDRPVSVGTRVPVNGHLMQVANVAPERLIMRASVDEEDKTRVEIGQIVKVTLYAYEGQVFNAVVKQIYPQADPDRRTFEVDMAIEPPDAKFSAGMTGELAFIVDQKPSALVVPSQSVQAGKVWVVREGRVEPVDVQVGLQSIERAEILTGLAVGDRIVISSAIDLTAGQRVRTKYLDPATAAGLNKPEQEQAVQGGIEKLQ